LTRQTYNTWGDISEEEQRARDAVVSKANFTARGLDTVIDTRARHLADEKPLPDRQVAQEAIQRAETRLLWAEWHAQQARRHRATLTHLVDFHEAEARRLGGKM
jgi:hypothetical protein